MNSASMSEYQAKKNDIWNKITMHNVHQHQLDIMENQRQRQFQQMTIKDSLTQQLKHKQEV